MAPLAFKDIELSDSSWIRELFAFTDYNSEDYNFTYQFLWRNTFKSKVARVGDLVLIQYNMDGRRSYLFPTGKAENSQIADLINSLLSDEGQVVFYGVLPQRLEFLEKHFKGRYTSELFRMGADYIYDAESLKTLKGKKYQSKRNFANGFRRNNNWTFEPITENSIAECVAMNDEWCKRNGCDENFWKSSEFCAVRIALNNYSALGLDGGLLRVDGKVIAFTVGEKANSDTLIVHIEKALTDYRGAYQAMSQEFLSYIDKKTSFTLVNREDDSGDENLRKAKMEYHPIEIKEKYLVFIK